MTHLNEQQLPRGLLQFSGASQFAAFTERGNPLELLYLFFKLFGFKVFESLGRFENNFGEAPAIVVYESVDNPSCGH